MSARGINHFKFNCNSLAHLTSSFETNTFDNDVLNIRADNANYFKETQR